MVIIKHYGHDVTNCLAHPSPNSRLKAYWSIPVPPRSSTGIRGYTHCDSMGRMRAKPAGGKVRAQILTVSPPASNSGAISVWAEGFRPERGSGCLIAQNAQNSRFSASACPTGTLTLGRYSNAPKASGTPKAPGEGTTSWIVPLTCSTTNQRNTNLLNKKRIEFLFFPGKRG